MKYARLLACLFPILVACASPATEASAPEAASPTKAPAAPDVGLADSKDSVRQEGEEYVFVWLRTGPATGLSAEESRIAGAGHFENMARLFAERSLLVAGPLGEPRAQPDDRGIFVLDVATLAAAEELTRTDPAVRAGVFRFDAEPFRSAQPLRRLFELEAEALAAGTDGMRSYVLARSPEAERAEAALGPLREEGLVAFSGRLGEREALFVLVTETLDEARDMLGFASEEDLGWVLSPWYGSLALERLQREPSAR